MYLDSDSWYLQQRLTDARTRGFVDGAVVGFSIGIVLAIVLLWAAGLGLGDPTFGATP